MANPNPNYSQLSVLERVGAGVLTPIPGDRVVTINEGKAPVVELAVSGAAGVQYSESKSLAIQLGGQGLSVTVPAVPAVGPAGDIRQRLRPFVFRPHGEDIPGVRLLVGREDALTAEVPAGAAPMTPGDPTPGDGETSWNSALAGLAGTVKSQRFHLFYDAAARQVGFLKVQLHKFDTAVLDAYLASQDLGNAGRALLYFVLPHTDGLNSGRATESAWEAVGAGPSYVCMRPKQSFESGFSFQDDVATPPWFQIGSLQDAKTFTREVEYSMTMKNRSNDRAGRSITTNQATFDIVATADSQKIQELCFGGLTRDEIDHKIHRPGNNPPELECVVFTTNAAGYLRGWYFPRVQLDSNGAVELGGESTEMPLQVYGLETPERLWDDALSTLVPVAIDMSVGP